MKFYKITGHVGIPATTSVKWAASQADAGKIRAAMVSAGTKRADIETAEFDVPTDKAGLLVWLNEHVK